jgi:hypothetical protein
MKFEKYKQKNLIFRKNIVLSEIFVQKKEIYVSNITRYNFVCFIFCCEKKNCFMNTINMSFVNSNNMVVNPQKIFCIQETNVIFVQKTNL